MSPIHSPTATCPCTDPTPPLRPGLGAGLPLTAVALLPKCPLCLMAYGGLFATAEISAFVTSPLVAAGLIAIGLLFAGLYAWRTRSSVFVGLVLVAMLAIVTDLRVPGLVILVAGYLIEIIRRRRTTTAPPSSP